MNFKTIAAAAAFATLGSSAFAQTYIGIGIGSSNACFHYDVAGDCTDDGVTGKLLLGYALPGTDFAIEGAYTHMGSFKGNSTLGNANVKVDTIGIGGAWRPQFGAGWGGVARGGVAFGKARFDETSIALGTPITIFRTSSSNDYWQPYVGAGVTYAITPRIRLEADLDVTRVKPFSSPINVRTVMLGATFGF